MTTEVLVKPASVEEQLLGKVMEMKQRNKQARLTNMQVRRTTNQLQMIEYYKDCLKDNFLRFCERYYDINSDQLQELTYQEFESLFFLTVRRAQKKSFYLYILHLSIPLFGWLLLIDPAPLPIGFIRSISRLEKSLGNSFNPPQFLYEKLGKPQKEEQS